MGRSPQSPPVTAIIREVSITRERHGLRFNQTYAGAILRVAECEYDLYFSFALFLWFDEMKRKSESFEATSLHLQFVISFS